MLCPGHGAALSTFVPLTDCQLAWLHVSTALALAEIIPAKPREAPLLGGNARLPA
jgi:hypothetical protein